MSSNAQLAIVIPAFKIEFLRETLTSIANQTCKDFKLYIGDDASPHDLYAIVKDFESSINIVYRRFDENLGGKDLVAHWNRCVEMVEAEEWVWLFSDDDLLTANCVELFYQTISNDLGYDLYHFNVDVIDGAGKVIYQTNPYPRYIDTSQFFTRRVTSQLHSYVVEYIFRKSLYESLGRFDSYDLAWCADDAAWIKFSAGKGIRTIDGGVVKWRYSTVNISSDLSNNATVIRKIKATINYLNWVKEFFAQNNLSDSTSDFEKLKTSFLIMIKSSSLPLVQKYKWTLYAINKLNYTQVKPLAFLYLGYCLLKDSIVPKKASVVS